MQEYFQKVVEFTLHRLASTFDRSLPSSDRLGGTFRAPLNFNGERPKEWIMQINQHYNALQTNDEARLADVASFLTGTALSYYCTTNKRAPELVPTTWEQFQDFIMQRFGMTPLLTTIRRLKESEYKGSFEEVVEKFSSILAEGEEPSDKILKDLSLSMFPYDMVERLLKHDFTSWVEMREQMLAESAHVANRATTWYEYTTEKFRREVERRDNLIRQGCVLNSK
ncbi:hypothetical protein EBH_0000200 [Eimeria brunetti]|uniref:Retrotransposon gag domain-containing protein n=1 Tax=Eimeria brunetti TaxID=51314 RepID=U6LTP2_9EIME|nr:hypothetical protein EBH_0000200 [Eimeria brunetti]